MVVVVVVELLVESDDGGVRFTPVFLAPQLSAILVNSTTAFSIFAGWTDVLFSAKAISLDCGRCHLVSPHLS